MVAVGNPIAPDSSRALPGASNAIEYREAKSLQLVTEVMLGTRCVMILGNPISQALAASAEILRNSAKGLGVDSNNDRRSYSRPIG